MERRRQRDAIRLDARAILAAHYMIQNKMTVRETAKALGVSKSTVHNDLTLRLPRISAILTKEVKAILDENKQARSQRGGQATQTRWKNTQ